MKKKINFWAKTFFGLLPKYIEKKKNYCNTVFVLQGRKLEGLEVLYCENKIFVLQG